MDAILAKRNLAKKEDSAQKAIDEKIQRMAISARETEFSIPVMPIAGDINLSKLKPLQISSIITKAPGHISDVVGIPDGVKHLKLEKQLLIESPQLPKSLETLDLTGNYIEKIDLSNFKQLKIVRLNNNRLKSVLLPESLEELYVDNNQIKSLNLDSSPKLRILHCRNNRTLRIENIPASIVDLKVEEGNPRLLLDYAFLPSVNGPSEETETAKGTETEFVESLHDYFELKSKYEMKAESERYAAKHKALARKLGEKQATKIARRIRPKCVNCKRPVGTVFKTREDRFLAYCGDTKEPCPLRIEIFRGHFESDDQFADYTEKSLEETKEKIIRQKMDVLFNYSTEEETVKQFKDLIEDYNLFAFLHKTDMDTREEKRFNLHKRELIKTKIKVIEDIKAAMNAHMDEYAHSGNRDSIQSAMDIYIREYMPEIHNLRMLKYSVMEMVFSINDIDEESRRQVLNQSAASIRELETIHGEVPKVIRFVTGAKQSPGNKPEVDGSEEEEFADLVEDNGEEEEEIPFSTESDEEPEEEREYE